MKLYKTEAIVLRDYDLGDQDKIVVFYSSRYGKIKVVAKGARRIKSRFAPLIQFPSYNVLLACGSEKRNLDILNECKIKHYFLGIKRDLLRFSYSCYLAELVDKLVGERDSYPSLFQMLLKVLFLLEKIPKHNLNLLMCSFEMKLLRILGYEPYLKGCINCRKDIKLISSPSFSLKLGGLLCSSCQGVDKEGISISKKIAWLMKYLLFSSLDKAFQKKVGKSTEKKIEKTLKAYFSYQGQMKMLTPRFIYTFEKLEQ